MLKNEGRGALILSGFFDFVISLVLLAGVALLTITALTAYQVMDGAGINVIDQIIDELLAAYGVAGADLANIVSIVAAGVVLLFAVLSIIYMIKDFNYCGLTSEGAKAKTGKIKFGAALQIIAALLYAGGVIYLIVTKDLGWGLITLLSLIIPVVVVAFAALLKLAAASKIKKFKLSSVNPAEVAYPYGGVPMGANIQESSRGYVYTPASAPVQQPIVNPNDPVFRLDTMFRNGLITREQYLNELEKLQSGKK